MAITFPELSAFVLMGVPTRPRSGFHEIASFMDES